jgi:DNA relaxase NicK
MNRTKVDWLSLRFREDDATPHLVPVLRSVFGSLGPLLNLSPRIHGWQGYRHSSDVRVGDSQCGLLAYGGEHQRGWAHLSLSGQGCAYVQDWDCAQDALATLPGMDLRRVDLALDTAGREVTHEAVIEAYRRGEFTTHGRPPKCQRIESERPEDGRTVYIGARGNDVFFRGYEKGLQLAAGTTWTHIDDVPIEDMYRLEVELKAKSRPLPQDVIDQRDQYFAGCYPYLRHVLRDVEPQIMLRDRHFTAKLELERALEHIRYQHGRTLFTALTVKHGDIGDVWSRIVGREHSKRLLDAGVLLLAEEE